MTVYVTSGKTYDESRNTSRVRPADPNNTRLTLQLLARSRHQPWHRWIVMRQRGEHDHAAVRSDGSRAACPVHGCTAPLDP
jgi:hypothetical protein